MAERKGCGALTFKQRGEFQLYSDHMYSSGWDMFIQCMDWDVDDREIYLKFNINIFDNDENKFYALK